MSPTVTPADIPADDLPHYVSVFGWLMLAGLGGAVKYTSTVIRGAERISHRRFLGLLCANIFISSFCGLIGTLLVSTISRSWEWHGIAAGTFGYLGTQGLDVIILTLRKKVGSEIPLSAVIPLPAVADPSVK
jgi:hypothetical protein